MSFEKPELWWFAPLY